MTNRGRWLLLSLLVASLCLSGCKTGSADKDGGDIEREPPIRATSAAAQQQFDRALKMLRDEQFDEAKQAFRLVQAEFSDDPIADLAELYVARAAMGPVRLEESFKPAAVDAYSGSSEAARILAALGDSQDVDKRVRFGATVYYALELALRGDHGDALAALRDYPSASVSDVVLQPDRISVRVLLAESLHRAGRHGVALEAASRLHEDVSAEIETFGGVSDSVLDEPTHPKPEMDVASNPRLAHLQSLEALALDRAFSAAEQDLEEIALQEYLISDRPLLRAAAGWGLLLRQLGEGVEDEQRAALEDLFNRIAPDLVGVGAAERAAELSMRLAAVGGPKRLAVGFLLPLSGSHKAIGERAMAGALVAMRAFEHGGYPEVTLVFQDSQAKAEQAFSRLEQQAVLAIIGPLDVRRARQFAPLAKASKIPMITLTAEFADETITNKSPKKPGEADESDEASESDSSAPEAPFVFRNFIDATAEARAAAQIAFGQMEDRKAAVVYPEVGYGRVTAKAFAEEFRALGGQVVVEVAYDRSKSDFAHVARQVAKANPAAIFLPDSAEKVAEVTAFFANENIWGLTADHKRSKRVRRQRVHYLGTSLWEDPILIRQAANYVEGAAIPVWFSPALGTPQIDRFVRRFEAIYGHKPGNFEAFSYDTTTWLRSLMLERGMRRPVAVRDALLAGDRHHGVTGPVQMTASGEPRRALRFVTPTSEGFEGLGFTAVTGPRDERGEERPDQKRADQPEAQQQAEPDNSTTMPPKRLDQ
jgi:branched-chain amino acid transport system substrate-binding protein